MTQQTARDSWSTTDITLDYLVALAGDLKRRLPPRRPPTQLTMREFTALVTSPFVEVTDRADPYGLPFIVVDADAFGESVAIRHLRYRQIECDDEGAEKP